MSSPHATPLFPHPEALFCLWPPAEAADYTRAPVPINERQRVAALERLEILDSMPEAAYDDLVTIASQICGTPMALISLVDRDRQWFKAKVGLDATETPREVSFCGHAIAKPEDLFVVPDATLDPRFRANPLVTGDPNVRFYAGAPIVTDQGEALGTVCVIDTVPRELSPQQRASLNALARQASMLLGMRRHLVETTAFAQRQIRLTAEATLQREHGRELLDLVLRGGELGMWDLHVPSGRYTCNAHEFTMLGYRPDQTGDDSLDWKALIHPDDLAASMDACVAHLRDGTPFYETRNRMRHRDGHWVRMLGRAVVVQRDAQGAPVRIVGTHRDISAIHAAAEAHAKDVAALERATSMQQRTSQLAHVGGWELDLRDGSIEWSDEVYRIHDREVGAAPHLNDAMNAYPPDSRATLKTAIDRSIADGTPWDLELPMITERGRSIWVRAMGRVAQREAGVATHLSGAIQDITERKTAELKLADHDRLLRGITDNVPVLIAEIGADEKYRFANRTYHEWFGVDHHALVGRPLAQISRSFYDSCKREIHQALAGVRSSVERPVVLPRGVRTLQSTYVPRFEDDGTVSGIYAVTIDITELKETQRELGRLARVDTLTGLANRRSFDERMPEARARIDRCGGEGALLYLDIDHFKTINDTLGHAAGDDVLRQFGERLRSRVRTTDLAVRYAGDEFIVVLEGLANADQAPTTSSRACACRSSSTARRSRSRPVSASPASRATANQSRRSSRGPTSRSTRRKRTAAIDARSRSGDRELELLSSVQPSHRDDRAGHRQQEQPGPFQQERARSVQDR